MAAVAEVIASAFASGMSWAGTIEGHPLYCPPPTGAFTGSQVMSIHCEMATGGTTISPTAPSTVAIRNDLDVIRRGVSMPIGGPSSDCSLGRLRRPTSE